MILNWRRKWISLLFVDVIVVVLFGAVANGVSIAASATVRVGYPQPSGAMLPLWLVSDARLDQKYGVAVQNIFISGAARMNQSMIAGDIDLASIRRGGEHRPGGRRSGGHRGGRSDLRLFALLARRREG